MLFSFAMVVNILLKLWHLWMEYEAAIYSKYEKQNDTIIHNKRIYILK